MALLFPHPQSTAAVSHLPSLPSPSILHLHASLQNTVLIIPLPFLRQRYGSLWMSQSRAECSFHHPALACKPILPLLSASGFLSSVNYPSSSCSRKIPEHCPIFLPFPHPTSTPLGKAVNSPPECISYHTLLPISTAATGSR